MKKIKKMKYLPEYAKRTSMLMRHRAVYYPVAKVACSYLRGSIGNAYTTILPKTIIDFHPTHSYSNSPL